MTDYDYRKILQHPFLTIRLAYIGEQFQRFLEMDYLQTDAETEAVTKFLLDKLRVKNLRNDWSLEMQKDCPRDRNGKEPITVKISKIEAISSITNIQT